VADFQDLHLDLMDLHLSGCLSLRTSVHQKLQSCQFLQNLVPRVTQFHARPSIFAARCYASAAYAVMRCLSACLFVTIVNSVKTSSRIFKFFSPSGSQTTIILVFLYQTSWRYSDGDPLTGASNVGGVGINLDSGRIVGYRSMAAAVCDQQLTVVGAVVYHSYGARLFTAQRPPCTSEYAEENRTEFIYTQR